jgi:PAS domain S-box-containing protein
MRDCVPTVPPAVLAVDADTSARLRRKEVLEEAGFRVIEAATRMETVGVARNQGPAAILLTSRLADAEGLRVCRELKSDPETASIPILMLAQQASAASYPDALEAGADAWLGEPVEPSILLRTVRALLARPQPKTGDPEEPREAPIDGDARWRTLVDTAPAILSSNRADGTCGYCNRTAYEYTGMPVGSLEGLNWMELIHPTDRPRIREAWAAGLRAGVPFDTEYRLRRADGEFRWFRSRNIPVVDDRSASLEWFGASVEIHELKSFREDLERLVAERTAQLQEANSQLLEEARERLRAEDALRESEEGFRSLFENATVGLYRTTPDGRILMANPALISMLGFDSFEELARRNLEEELFEPGYARGEFRRRIESEGTICGLETSWIRRDGTPVFIRESARVVRDPGGAVRFYDGIIEDFTRRKQAEETLRASEERFRAIIDQASVGIVQATLDGQLQVVNNRFCEITGYARAELLSIPFRRITHPDDLSANLEQVRRLVSGEISSFNMEKRYLRRDGGTVWVKVFGSRVVQREGSPDSIVVVAEDISERKLAEEELQHQLQFDGAIADLLTRFATCSGSEIDQVIHESLRAVAGYCGADHALVVMWSDDAGIARCTNEWCAPQVVPQISRMQAIGADSFPWIAQRVRNLETATSLPPEAGAEREWIKHEGALATLHVPIEGRKEGDGTVIGCIVLHRHRDAQPWSLTDLTRLRIMGNTIAAVLERQRAEESLRESEEKFSLVFHASPEAILITSAADQRLTDVNPRFCAVSGYSREEAIGKTTQELGLFPDPANRAQVWSQLLEHRALSDFDQEFKHKSGAVRTGLLSSVVVSVHERQYLISMFRDLTHRRQAEEALRRQAAFDSLMTGMLSEFVRYRTSDLAKAVEKAIAAIARFFAADHALLHEVSPEMNSWRITHEWCAPHVLPVIGEDKHLWLSSAERLSSDTDIVFDVASPGPADNYDERYREEGATAVLNVPIKGAAGVVTGRIGLHRHGDPMQWTPEDAARLRLAGNAIAGALERKRAEDSLRESEARFRDLADSAPISTWISGPDKLAVFYSRQAVEFSGRSLEELVGNGWMELVHPDDRERYVQACFAAADAREPLSTEVRFRRADGEYRWFLITGVPRMVDGAYQGHIGTGVDITDLKRGFERHLVTQKLESLGVLAAGVAHDFNNLLGAIIARAESAQIDLEPGSPATDDVEQIHVTALRAAEIVSQLMTFARQENAPHSAIDLSQLVAEMLELLKVSIGKTAVLKTELAPDLPAVRANPAEVRQVVMNLILNASEALEDKPGFITLRTSLVPMPASSGRVVRLEVTDTGCGMTPEVKARIFDPFFTTHFAGRGLGLSAVQGIIRRHGGTIEVASISGQGSRFTLQLPCVE